ncbi:sodium/potassium-transporting ATPase subunit beta-3-like [Eucyclogobius newberryi]|uniref:sodium/potassium-transporting ATPase subunit beta-3-like n=1 Tax=Eucyclogobius newberryi TaxID=166745 RepID=UPI003B5C2AD6
MSNTNQKLDQNQDQNQDQMQDQNQDQMQDQNQDHNQNSTKPGMNQQQNKDLNKKQKNQQPKPARAKIQTRVQTGVHTGVQTHQNQIQENSQEAETFCSFIYNPRTGAVLGRTRSSWGKILLFYSVFYSLLSAMFCFTLWMVLLTLDPDSPKYSDLLKNPGLVVKPQVLEISFNRSEPSEFSPYVEQLHQLLHKYNDSIQAANDLCLAGEFTVQDQNQDRELVQRKVCQFKRSALRSCSGLTDPLFGFKDGRPCVLIRMNRVVGLKPSGDPFINCTSKSPIKMQYFPPDARLDRMFYPYYGKRTHAGYVQPLVALKLLLSRRDLGVFHSITCRVQGSGIQNQNSRDRNQGRVSFKVRVMQ